MKTIGKVHYLIFGFLIMFPPLRNLISQVGINKETTTWDKVEWQVGQSGSDQYDAHSAFRFISEEKDESLLELSRKRPDLLKEKIAGGAMPIHYAALLNRTTAIKVLYDINPEWLEAQTDEGATPAYLAAQQNNVEALDLIAKYAVKSLSIKLRNGVSASQNAAVNDALEAIQVITKYVPAALLEANRNGLTPAHFAVMNNALDTLKGIKLLSPESLKIVDKEGLTPLTLAKKLERTECITVLMGTASKDKPNPSEVDWVKVRASAAVVRLTRQWTSRRLPVAKNNLGLLFSDIQSDVAAQNINGNPIWDWPGESPRSRLLFFTSAEKPLKNLSQLNPAHGAKQFAFYDSSLMSAMLYFLAVAQIAPTFDERAKYALWIRAGGKANDLFKGESSVKLYVTYTIFEEDIRKAGGVPVKFILGDNYK